MSEVDPRLSGLYREVSSEEPPSALDAAILAAAKQRIAAPKRNERRRWQHWIVPASLMAMVVLGVSITLQIARERPETVAGPTGAPLLRDASSPPLAASIEAEEGEVAVPEVAAIPVPAPAAPVLAPAGGEPAGRVASEMRTRRAALPSVYTGATDRKPSANDEVVPAEQRAEAVDSPAVPAPTVESDIAGSPTAAAPKARSLRQDASPPGPAASRSPVSWLEEIRRLKREGRMDEAGRQLTEFERAYPEIPLPADLDEVRRFSR